MRHVQASIRSGRMMFGRCATVRCLRLACLRLGLACLHGMFFAATTSAIAQTGNAPKTVNAPLPPPRPFDLFLPSGKLIRVAPTAQPSQPASPSQPAAADPAPRSVSNAPAPPRRSETAPMSRPEDEEDDAETTWPRRTPAQKDIPFEPRITPQDDVNANGVSTDPGTSTRCLPAPLQRVLQALVKNYGSVRVTSTFRPAWRARRNSYHRRCQAMDLRVPGQSPRTILQFVKTLPETGGHKVYWSGLVHVDTGPWRSW